MRATRRRLLAGGVAALVAPPLAWAADPPDEEDLAAAALVAVLELEQTAEVAYEAIANKGVLTAVLRGFLDQERQHVKQLELALDALGKDAPTPPRRTEIRGLERATTDAASASHFAIGLELRTVVAWQRAIRDVLDPNFMRTAAGAMGTDAQQLVVLRRIAGMPPVPNAIEDGR